MSLENEICLWCQDALTGHGPVIELTTDDFKNMFKHDAKCKKIHRKCLSDYQYKRAKSMSEDEQKREHGFSEPEFNQRTGHFIIRVSPWWFRNFIAVLSIRNASVHVGIQRVTHTSHVAFWPEHSRYCTSNQRRTIARPIGIEQHYHNTTPIFWRPVVPAHQTLPTRWTIPRQTSTLQFRHQQSTPIQFRRPSFPPSTEQLFQNQVNSLQPTWGYYDRISPYTSTPGYFFTGFVDRVGNNIYVQMQPIIHSNPYAFYHQPSSPRNHRTYSEVNQTQNRSGYRSVYQEHTHFQEYMHHQWSDQSPEAFG